ncbi:MAG: hypothetical protein KC549_19540, partial [Myxococcales bacterium]|nr:hypothetical protein [Myxococcales bacterium]
GRQVRVRLTGSAVAELANAAIARGEMPGRYTEKGKADPQGPLQAALAWERGDRPLKALLWRTEGTCMTARIGGTPSLQAARRQVTVRLADGRVEDVQGSLLIQAGAWLKGLWDQTFTVTRTVAAETRLALGARRLTLGVVDARADADGVTLGLDVQTGPAK